MTSEQSGSSERAAAEHAPGMVRVSVEVDEDAPLAPEEGSPPPPRARGADGAPLETKWQARQRAVFTRWINQRLARRGGPVVEDLYVDLRDGFALVAGEPAVHLGDLVVAAQHLPEHLGGVADAAQARRVAAGLVVGRVDCGHDDVRLLAAGKAEVAAKAIAKV